MHWEAIRQTVKLGNLVIPCIHISGVSVLLFKTSGGYFGKGMACMEPLAWVPKLKSNTKSINHHVCFGAICDAVLVVVRDVCLFTLLVMGEIEWSWEGVKVVVLVRFEGCVGGGARVECGGRDDGVCLTLR